MGSGEGYGGVGCGGYSGVDVPHFSILPIYLTMFWFVLRLNIPVNNFSVMSGRSHCFLGN